MNGWPETSDYIETAMQPAWKGVLRGLEVILLSACETLQIMLGFIQTIVILFIALNDRANKKQPLPVQGCGYFLSS